SHLQYFHRNFINSRKTKSHVIPKPAPGISQNHKKQRCGFLDQPALGLLDNSCCHQHSIERPRIGRSEDQLKQKSGGCDRQDYGRKKYGLKKTIAFAKISQKISQKI